MAQMSVAPPSIPVIAASQAATPQGMAADAAPGDEAGIDFAAVLKAQIAPPAKDAPETENIAALMPTQPRGSDEEAPTEGGLPVAPDLAALIPALAALMPAAAARTPAVQTAAVPADDRRTFNPTIPNALLPNATIPNPNGTTSDAADPITTTQVAANGIPVSFAQIAAEAQGSGENSPHPHLQSPPATGLSDHKAQDASKAANPGGIEAQLPAAPADRARPIVAEAQMLPIAADQAKPMAADSLAAATPIASAVSDAPVSGTAALVHIAPAASTQTSMRIETPVGNHGWDAELAQKIVLLANRHEGRAELTLTPPQLGKVEITISINGDQTSATFVSASPAAREALEQALPRLREMMAEAGISLGQASVSAESAQRGQDESPTTGRGGRGSDAPRDNETTTQWVQRSSGLIDTFA